MQGRLTKFSTLKLFCLLFLLLFVVNLPSRISGLLVHNNNNQNDNFFVYAGDSGDLDQEDGDSGDLDQEDGDSGDLEDSSEVKLSDPLGVNGDVTKVGKNLISGALGVSGILALIAFIWGGIEWMTSGGKDQRIAQGKSMMIWAVVGLVVIFGSYAIINLVFRVLGG